MVAKTIEQPGITKQRRQPHVSCPACLQNLLPTS